MTACAYLNERFHCISISFFILGFDLSINVEVDPPGAYLGENRFLAAAGPITVECLPVKANGTVTFEWSSTCEACPFINSTLSTIVIPYLTSDVTGNHTCNATDESGESKEATLEFNVVGELSTVRYC